MYKGKKKAGLSLPPLAVEETVASDPNANEWVTPFSQSQTDDTAWLSDRGTPVTRTSATSSILD